MLTSDQKLALKTAVEADLARVRGLLQLWQEQADSLEDEEILLMLMA